ncbi:response regulator [Streptomyces gamaensis]|uniref:Response regulator n=1 Tax=Streptomyces gamaensis TaxID=1763542 RepID=A0ABW0Z6T5_9ACTN
MLADDEEIVCEGLRAVLGAAEDIQVVATAGSGTEALTAVREHVPDVLVLDLDMPGMNGVAVARRLRETTPRPGVLILTAHSDDEMLAKAWRAGVCGFMLKSSSTADLLHAVRSVAAESAVLAPALVRTLMDRFAENNERRQTDFERRLETLSGRERGTVVGIARGLTNREIAQELGVAEGTIKAYVSRSLRKMKLHNRTQLAVQANRSLPVPPGPGDVMSTGRSS